MGFNPAQGGGGGAGGGTPDDNSVSTAKIQNDAVTYAKIQNVSATDKVLGRSTAGAGDVEEIACTAAGRALLDDASASAQLTTLGAMPLAGGTFSGDVTMGDGINVVLDSTTGTKIGTASTQKLGFFDAAPVVRQSQPAAANFSSNYATDGNDIVSAVNGLRTALINLGLIGP